MTQDNISDDAYYDMLEEADNLGSSFSDWEMDFIENILSKKPKILTGPQKDVIERLYNYVQRGA